MSFGLRVYGDARAEHGGVLCVEALFKECAARPGGGELRLLCLVEG